MFNNRILANDDNKKLTKNERRKLNREKKASEQKKQKTMSGIKKAFILAGGLSLAGISTYGVISYLNKNKSDISVEQKTGEYIRPQSIMKNQRVLMTNPELAKYGSKPFELYSIPTPHRDMRDMEQIIKELKPLIEKLRAENKEPVILMERPIDFGNEVINAVVANSSVAFGDGDIWLRQGEFEILKMGYEQKLNHSEEIFNKELQSGNIPAEGTMNHILKFIKNQKLKVYFEIPPIESSVLMALNNVFIENIQKDLIMNHQSVHAAIRLFHQSYETANAMRTAQVLERVYQLTKQKNVIPIVVMGGFHNFKAVPGAENLKFLDQNKHYRVTNVYAWTFMSIMFPIFDRSSKFNKLKFEDQIHYQDQLFKKIDESKINLLMTKISYEYPNKDFDWTSIKAQKLLLNWLYLDVDPTHESEIWKFIFLP